MLPILTERFAPVGTKFPLILVVLKFVVEELFTIPEKVSDAELNVVEPLNVAAPLNIAEPLEVNPVTFVVVAFNVNTLFVAVILAH